MKLPRARMLRFAVEVATLAFASVSFLAVNPLGAWAQTTRTIKIVVPNPPGGPSDTLARLLAEKIGPAHGTTMVIENRPGASQVIGTDAVSRAA